MTPRILTIDIELAPNLGHLWGLWNQNVGITQLREASYVLCFAAKWLDDPQTIFYSIHRDGKETMLQAAHDLLSEADIIITYNGRRFDLPHLSREFLENGLLPPAPYQQVDLLQIVRKQFKFPSNKLDYVTQTLGLGAKQKHSGHQLWVDCIAGDDKAWRDMESYNRHDVVLTEKLYIRILPWVQPHTPIGLFTGKEDGCPNCGSDKLQARGYQYTTITAYRRYRCSDCGKWSRSTERIGKIDKRGI
jgi:hypothetical protein